MWWGVVIFCEWYLPETTIGIQFAEHLAPVSWASVSSTLVEWMDFSEDIFV